MAEASLLTQEPLVPGIVKTILVNDAFSAVIPTMPVDGKARVLNRQATDHGATWTDINATVDKTAATVTRVTHHLGRAVGDVEIDTFEINSMSNIQDIAAQHVDMLAYKLGKLWRAAVVDGNTSFPTPMGLEQLADEAGASQEVDHTDGGTTSTVGFQITLDNMDLLLGTVTAEGEMPFLVMNITSQNRLRSQMRAAGYGADETIELGFLDPTTGQRGYKKVMAYSGVPVFRNDNIGTYTTNSQSGRTKIYAGIFGGEGIHAMLPRNINQFIQLGIPFPAESRPVLIWRANMEAGLTNTNPKAIARAANVTTAAPS